MLFFFVFFCCCFFFFFFFWVFFFFFFLFCFVLKTFLFFRLASFRIFAWRLFATTNQPLYIGIVLSCLCITDGMRCRVCHDAMFLEDCTRSIECALGRVSMLCFVNYRIYTKWVVSSQKSVFEHAQNVRIHIILRMRKFSSEHLLSMHSIVSNDSASEQRMPRSDCADAQADLGLRCLHMPRSKYWATYLLAICLLKFIFDLFSGTVSLIKLFVTPLKRGLH